MAKKRAAYDPFICDALAIAAELAALRHDPAALGRLVVSLAQTSPEGSSGQELSSDRKAARVAGAE